MKRIYRLQINVIDFLYELFFSIACWLEQRRKSALKRWETARGID